MPQLRCQMPQLLQQLRLQRLSSALPASRLASAGTEIFSASPQSRAAPAALNASPGPPHPRPRARRLVFAGRKADRAGLASSPNVLVNATQEWCKSMDMRLNGAKTQYLSVNPDPRTPSTSLEVAGVRIGPVQEVKYLGLQIHAKNGLQAGIKNLEQRFWIAWEDLTRAYSNLGCNMSMMLMTELYLACLPPLISYGCEVWAFRCFQGRQLSSGKPSSIPLLDAHKRVLAQILGVRRTIPEEIINCELNIFSLWSTWILRMARFWNNIAAMRPDSLHYKVLMHDIRLAIVEGRETFSGTLMQQLKKLGYYIADHVRFDRALQIDISQVKDLLDRKSDMIWDDLDISPRTCASPRALFCRYLRWFARPPHVPRRKSALKLHLPNCTLRTFMQFRLGCHDLPIDKGRQQGIPRDQRICTRCSLELVGDEHHLLFTCPAVQHVRQQFMHLFQQRSRSVQTFMWQEDLEGVAKFVTRALESYLTLPGERSTPISGGPLGVTLLLTGHSKVYSDKGQFLWFWTWIQIGIQEKVQDSAIQCADLIILEAAERRPEQSFDSVLKHAVVNSLTHSL
eukprot:jgi/Botrbrau1/15281/Bobra.97_1s0007.1